MESPPPAPQEEPEKPYKPVSWWFLFLMIRTKRGLGVLDDLGKWRVTRPLAWIMLYITPIAAAIALYVIAFEVSVLYFSPESHQILSNVRTISPLANFLLPGINPYLPLSVWLAVIAAVVIHESAHGIVARSLGLRVKAAGMIFFLILPLGAFVELDDKQVRQAKSRDSLRVLGAGSGINFIVGVACILLLILTVSSMVPAAKGAAIIGVVQPSSSQASPAYEAGIQPGDFVTAINGGPITDLQVLHNGSFSVGEAVNVTVWHDGKTRTIDNLVLASYPVTTVNETSGKSTTVTYPFMGVEEASYGSLVATAGSYASLYKTSPFGYLAEIPTFGAAGDLVPFSTVLSPFYTSPFGSLTPLVTNAMYWMFFVNFSLAIFNALPIYPMDGGQAFEAFLRGVGGGRISEELARRVTTGVTLVVFFALFAVIAGPYITGVLPPY